MMENELKLYDVLNHAEVFNLNLDRAYHTCISNHEHLPTGLITSMKESERLKLFERLLEGNPVETLKKIFDEICNTDLYKILNAIETEIDDYLKGIKIDYQRDYASTYLFFLNITDNFKIKNPTLQKQVDNHEVKAVINKIKMNLIFRKLAVIAYSKRLPYLSLNMYRLSEIAMGQAMALNGQDIEIFVKRSIHKEFSEYGREGGNSKGGNFEPTKQKILTLHDEKFSEKKQNGKFEYSHALAARTIKKQLKIECYEERSIANIIAKHREIHFTP